jgi:tetratricopeptide (TPR) repeat protein
MSNMLKIPLVVIALTFIILNMPVYGENSAIRSAVESYTAADYESAYQSFDIARKSGASKDDERFAEYAVSKMREFKAELRSIQADEAELKSKGYDETFAISLAKKHHGLAAKLMEGQFYIALVEAHLKRAGELDPRDAAIFFDLGNAYYVSYRYHDAIGSYEKAMLLNPSNPGIPKMAADACVAAGDFDRAKRLYNEALKANEEAVSVLKPNEVKKIKDIMKSLPETYKDIDDLLSEGKYDEAQALLRKRLSLNQSDYIAMTKLGEIYLERQDRPKALSLFEAAVKIAPDYPLAHLYLGRLYFLMRRPDSAIRELNIFKKKMKLLPKTDEATRKMYITSLQYLCEVYFTLGRQEDFYKEIKEILKLDPKNQMAIYNLGIFYYNYRHDRGRAYELLEEVIAVDPESEMADRAKAAIETIRRKPDPRFQPKEK